MRRWLMLGLALSATSAFASPADQLINTALARGAALQTSKVDVTRYLSYSGNTQRKIDAVKVVPIFMNGTTAKLPASGDVVIVKADASTKPVTLVPATGQTVLQEAIYNLWLQGETIHLRLSGTNWFKF